MTGPFSFVELSSAYQAASAEFLRAVFGWDPMPFALPDCLVAPRGDSVGPADTLGGRHLSS